MDEAIHFDQPIEAAVNAGPRRHAHQVLSLPGGCTSIDQDRYEVQLGRHAHGSICDVVPANYIGMFGTSEPGVDGEGIFFRNSAIRITDISDGASQTILVGERHYALAPATWVGAVTGGEIFPYNSSNFVLGHTGESKGPTEPIDINGFSSRHTGSVNFLFADGHVRPLTSAVSVATYLALSTRAGGETIGGDF